MSTRFLGLLLIATLCSCMPNVQCRRDLDRMETRLGLTRDQKPAWQEFRKEALAAEASWKRDFSGLISADSFDESRANAAADKARRDASKLISAWKKVDASLTSAQKRALRRSDRSN